MVGQNVWQVKTSKDMERQNIWHVTWVSPQRVWQVKTSSSTKCQAGQKFLQVKGSGSSKGLAG